MHNNDNDDDADGDDHRADYDGYDCDEASDSFELRHSLAGSSSTAAAY